jgi:hypothetical protein
MSCCLFTHKKPVRSTYVPEVEATFNVTVSGVPTTVPVSVQPEKVLVNNSCDSQTVNIVGNVPFSFVLTATTQLDALSFVLSVPKCLPVPLHSTIEGLSIINALIQGISQTIGATFEPTRVDKHHIQILFTFVGATLPAGTYQGSLFFDITYTS